MSIKKIIKYLIFPAVLLVIFLFLMIFSAVYIYIPIDKNIELIYIDDNTEIPYAVYKKENLLLVKIERSMTISNTISHTILIIDTKQKEIMSANSVASLNLIGLQLWKKGQLGGVRIDDLCKQESPEAIIKFDEQDIEFTTNFIKKESKIVIRQKSK